MDVEEKQRQANSLLDLIARYSQARGELLVLRLADEVRVAAELGVSRWEVEVAALEYRVLPGRYERSFGTLGWDGQLKLLRSTVAVIGAGGLGGYVVEGLARMGLGRLIVVDGDTFEDHNLNRQVLCTEANLGQSKALAAAERVRLVNPAVRVDCLEGLATSESLPGILAGADLVVDALDSLPDRILLQAAAAERGIPMVHGAIAGYMAQVTTIFPGDAGLSAVYGSGDLPQKGVEVELGNPAATPMLCAALQVQAAIKVLVGVGEPLRNRLLMIDAEMGEMQVLRW